MGRKIGNKKKNLKNQFFSKLFTFFDSFLTILLLSVFFYLSLFCALLVDCLLLVKIWGFFSILLFGPVLPKWASPRVGPGRAGLFWFEPSPAQAEKIRPMPIPSLILDRKGVWKFIKKLRKLAKLAFFYCRKSIFCRQKRTKTKNINSNYRTPAKKVQNGTDFF